MSHKASRKLSAREAKRALYRELVVDAAEVIFASDGYEQTKMQRIADEAGLSIATLYKLYPGKWDLFRAVHDRRGQGMMARVQERLADLAKAAADSPLAVICEGIAVYVSYLLEHPDYLRMHLREGGLWASSGALKTEDQVALWNSGLKLIAGIFATAQKAGVLNTDDSPEAIGRTMIAMQQARLAMWSEGQQPQDPGELTLSLQRQFVRAFCPTDVATAWFSSDRNRAAFG